MNHLLDACFGKKKCDRRRLSSRDSMLFRTPPQSPPPSTDFSFVSPVEKPSRMYRRVEGPSYKDKVAPPVDKKQWGYNSSDRYAGLLHDNPKKLGGKTRRKKLKGKHKRNISTVVS